MFILEDALRPGLHPLDRLRLDLVQAIAMVECLRGGWCEPPRRAGLHLSTLIHQTLALIMQVGAVKPTTAWNVLCGRGPFQTVSRELFARLLRVMGHPERELISMSPDGLLMIGRKGEFLAESYEFYAVFETPEEYRIVHGTKTLGTYPVENMLAPGQTIIFAGRRWRILVINDDARAIEVTPTRAALPPTFGGGGGDIHDRIVATIQDVLKGTDVPVYLDGAAKGLLDEARSAFFELGLDRSAVLAVGKDVCLLPWVGTRKLETLALALLARGFKASPAGHAIFLNDCAVTGVHNALSALAASPAPEAAYLAERVAKPHRAK